MNNEIHNWKVLWSEFCRQLKSILSLKSVLAILFAIGMAFVERSGEKLLQGHKMLEGAAVALVALIVYALSALMEAAAVTSKTLTQPHINTYALEELSKDSTLIIYFSNLPSFSDWFKPELVSYLLKTSPLLRDLANHVADKPSGHLATTTHGPVQRQHAVRVFIVETSAFARLSTLSGHQQTKCAEALCHIHDCLGIIPMLLTTEEVSTLKRCTHMDCCIGFKDVKSPGELLQKRTDVALGHNVTVLVPDKNTLNQVTHFNRLDASNGQRQECIQFGISVIGKLWKPVTAEYDPQYSLARIRPHTQT